MTYVSSIESHRSELNRRPLGERSTRCKAKSSDSTGLESPSALSGPRFGLESHPRSVPEVSRPEPVARSTDAEMESCWAPLCDRCSALHLPGDRFCARCRAEVDVEFAGVPT
jgi:hypothetical protein